MNNLILFIYSLIFIYFSILWVHTMIFYDGFVSFNRYGEGYLEAVMFAFMGIIGLWAANRNVATVNPVEEIYDPLV